ncbi:hypothetical protein CPB84DRAFT_381179 [Gymnopilus junonius]|uniref:RWD domain-containing protein n=1 Tax=Gymnopilus junonius TaxID=109634 RepID=A0A9P5ND65_GYMJU|nr:hypothetical protein CPB84DRAFT_381179 [Gymnopilus junonius]
MSSLQRDDELLSVQAIYCDAFNTFEAVDSIHFRFHSSPIVLSIMLPLAYPNPLQIPEISIDSEGLGVSRLQMFELRMRLESILQDKPGEPVLFELTEETREFTESLRDDVRMSLEEVFDEEDIEDCYEEDEEDATETRILDNTTVHSHMGPTTLASITAMLPQSTRLLHAEAVLRTDLRKRYMDMRRKIQIMATHGMKDRRAKDQAWDRYGKEEIVFHGTLRQNVGSIVRSGFVVPGKSTATGDKVSVRCGSTWGQGIYTSPDPNYSLSYTDTTREGEVDKNSRRLLPGQKLIVCAITMGRKCMLTGYRRLNDTVEEGYDSHVAPNGLEYIVFQSAQVLPLYVLHLGNGNNNSDQPLTANRGPGPVHFEGNLTEYARKHLPNGFGAASGHRFVVEAIAPVDEDEEVWGDYQHEEGEFQWERRQRRPNWWY